MATRIEFTCPIDGLVLGTVALTPLGDTTRDSGGDFTRDPSQHTHERGRLQATCPNGHRYVCEVDLVMERRDPNAQVAGGR